MRSVSPGGTSAPSGQASATTQSAGVPIVPVTPPSSPTVPTAPTGLVASTVSSTQINLAWSPSSTSGVTYSVYNSSGLIASGLAVDELLCNRAHGEYQLHVYGDGGEQRGGLASFESGQRHDPGHAGACCANGTCSYRIVSVSQINLNWNASTTSGVTYSVYSGAALGAETNLLASGLSGTGYAATGLSASTTYYYIVKAVSGTSSSTASNEASATTQAAASGGCHVVYTDQNDWSTGFTGVLTITNNGSTAMNSWTVSWTFSGNQQIYTSWERQLHAEAVRRSRLRTQRGMARLPQAQRYRGSAGTPTIVAAIPTLSPSL